MTVYGNVLRIVRRFNENGHLRVRVPSDSLSSTIVARPGQRALEWLKTMFQLLEMRPVIPLKEVGKLWRTTEREIIATCKHYRIPIYSEPVFGYLMSFDSLKHMLVPEGNITNPSRSTGLDSCVSIVQRSATNLGRALHVIASGSRWRSIESPVFRSHTGHSAAWP